MLQNITEFFLLKHKVLRRIFFYSNVVFLKLQLKIIFCNEVLRKNIVVYSEEILFNYSGF